MHYLAMHGLAFCTCETSVPERTLVEQAVSPAKAG
jgi:hypothetical protein